MTLDEQKAFVEAYDNTFCNISKAKVAKIVSCYINKLDLSDFPTYELTSVIDALALVVAVAMEVSTVASNTFNSAAVLPFARATV